MPTLPIGPHSASAETPNDPRGRSLFQTEATRSWFGADRVIHVTLTMDPASRIPMRSPGVEVCATYHEPGLASWTALSMTSIAALVYRSY